MNMIISRTPVRMSIGGGGTDLPSYYSRFGGFLISAAIDKYVYIALKNSFEESIRVRYSTTEVVDRVEEIRHPIVREALRLHNVDRGLEIVSIADVPARTGLGTSGSFTVGLLNALHAYKSENITTHALAEEACHIGIDVLKEPVGKQDQYIASFGGITCFDIDRDGVVTVDPMRISGNMAAELEANLLLFYTGVRRDASKILIYLKEAEERGVDKVVENMHRIKEIGYEIREALVSGDLRRFGELLDLHWRRKRGLSGQMSNSRLDELYRIAKRSGAIGGKIMGAGGGGFFMFYCEEGRETLRNEMRREGLKEMRFRFDYDGSKIVLDL